MKTIIKEGKKEFTTTCSKCGCEFKYGLSDVSLSSVYCPCCGNSVYHIDQRGQNYVVRDNLGNPVYPYTEAQHRIGGTVITTYPPKYINDIDIPSSFCKSDSSQIDNTIITTTYNDNTENKYE